MIELRSVTQDDVATVTKMVGSLLLELHDGEPGSDDRVCSVAEVLRETGRSFGFLAYERDRPVGILMMTEGVAIFAGGVYGQITELFVERDVRSQGVASILVQRAAEYGRERGWKRLDVGAPHQPQWSRTLNFYRSEGFVEVGPRLRMDL